MPQRTQGNTDTGTAGGRLPDLGDARAGSVLVKGSRSMKMEHVVQALESACGEGAACC